MLQRKTQTRKLNTVALLICALAAGCSPQSPPSQVKEAPNAYNSSTRMGLSGPFPWSTLHQSPTSFQLSQLPWTDTYWPTYKKGLAWRYRNPAEGFAQFSLHAFLEPLYEAINTREIDKLANLSPAEKHDLARLWIAGERFEQWPHLLEQSLAVEEVASEELEALKESNLPSVETERKASEIIRDLVRSGYSLLSDSKEFSAAFPLTSSEWKKWARLTIQPDNRLFPRSVSVAGLSIAEESLRNWSWEGICHGWAPAAQMASRPESSVMIGDDTFPILFLEGDIRALLSKAWADLDPWDKQVFVGQRCNIESHKILADSFGRSLDGKIECSRCKYNGMGFHIEREYDILSRKVYRVSLWDSSAPPIYLVRTRPADSNDSFHSMIFDDFLKLRLWIRSSSAPNSEALITVQSQCRDINPATFHLLLTQVLSNGQPFVMDRTGSSEVWNQPVYGYEMNYAPIPGGSANPQTPTPVNSIVDPYWKFRSPGTKSLVQVRATVKWATELGPYSVYRSEGVDIDLDALDTSLLSYTLELDENDNLIGGEWGPFPIENQTEVSGAYRSAPDFVYYYQKDAVPVTHYSHPLEMESIVNHIHKCSTSPGATQLAQVLDEWGAPIRYTTCD